MCVCVGRGGGGVVWECGVWGCGGVGVWWCGGMGDREKEKVNRQGPVKYYLTFRLRVTNSGHGNSANSPVNNFRVDAYTTINSAGALVRKDS